MYTVCRCRMTHTHEYSYMNIFIKECPLLEWNQGQYLCTFITRMLQHEAGLQCCTRLCCHIMKLKHCLRLHVISGLFTNPCSGTEWWVLSLQNNFCHINFSLMKSMMMSRPSFIRLASPSEEDFIMSSVYTSFVSHRLRNYLESVFSGLTPQRDQLKPQPVCLGCTDLPDGQKRTTARYRVK